MFKLKSIIYCGIAKIATFSTKQLTEMCDYLNQQTLKREKPKPIAGKQQTQEILLTKGTKGEKYEKLLRGLCHEDFSVLGQIFD